MDKYEDIRSKAEKDYKKLPATAKKEFKADFEKYIERTINVNEIINHISKSPLFSIELNNEFQKFINNYKNVVKYPDILAKRQDELKITLERLLFNRIIHSTGFLNLIEQFYKSNGKNFDNLLEMILDHFKPIINEIFLLPNLFVDILQLNDDNWEIKYKGLKDFEYIHTNKKGKEWRDKLFEIGKQEFDNNKDIDHNKTLALKAGFEKLTDKEHYREEYNLKFDSIYRTFIKKFK